MGTSQVVNIIKELWTVLDEPIAPLCKEANLGWHLEGKLTANKAIVKVCSRMASTHAWDKGSWLSGGHNQTMAVVCTSFFFNSLFVIFDVRFSISIFYFLVQFLFLFINFIAFRLVSCCCLTRRPQRLIRFRVWEDHPIRHQGRTTVTIAYRYFPVSPLHIYLCFYLYFDIFWKYSLQSSLPSDCAQCITDVAWHPPPVSPNYLQAA